MHVYLCACIPHMSGCQWRAGKDIGSPGAGAISDCELPGVGAGK